MGEIIYSIAVGGFLIASGIAMYIVIVREEQQLFGKHKRHRRESKK